MKIRLCTVLLTSALAGAASAGTVHINPSTAIGDPFAGPVVARAAASFTPPRNSGAGAGAGLTTSNTDPRRGAAQLQDVWYSFLLSNTPGQGWALSLIPDARPGTNGAISSKVWRQAIDASYNSIVLKTQAGAAGLARVDVNGLQFSAPGHSLTGSFPDLDVSTSGLPGVSRASRAAALADFDLSRVAWSLSGRIGIAQDLRAVKPSDEIGLWFSGVNSTASLPTNGQFNVVPLPTSAVLGGAGMLALAGVRRRRA